MAGEQNFLQRGLSGFRETVRELRTGEGKGGAAQVGKSAKNAGAKMKAGLGKLKKTLGFSGVDEWTPDEQDDQRRRKRARELLGDDEPTFTGAGQRDPKRDLSTVAPEFRAQVSSGLAA